MKREDKDYLEKIIQDLRVKLRDIDDFKEARRMRKIIKNFQTNFNDGEVAE